MDAKLLPDIEKYKVMLARYHGLLLEDIRTPDQTIVFSEALLAEHQSLLIKAKDEKNFPSCSDILLSLRINALNLAPPMRVQLIRDIVKHDLFLLKAKNTLL